MARRLAALIPPACVFSAVVAAQLCGNCDRDGAVMRPHGLVRAAANAVTPPPAEKTTYRASVETVGVATDNRFVNGRVFQDLDRDGRYDRSEPGIPNVLVSNGRDVVLTGAGGVYRLPNIYDYGANPTKPEAMTIFVTKPAGYEVPVDNDNVPQFSYNYIPTGSPPSVHGVPFRFGGLPPSGPLPRSVNFPLVRGQAKRRFKIVVSGDTQTYSNNEVGYVRDTLARELVAMPDLDAVIVEGDVMGDDLSLFPRFKQALGLANAPQYYVPGNHDVDFDSPTNENSFDTFKREWGPAYYSFDVGNVHFIVLNDIRYPCTPEQDNQDGLHPQCDEPQTSPVFNAVITEDQIQWLRNDLAHVPVHKLIVLNMHATIYSFINQNSARETVDNGVELVEALGCVRAPHGTFPPDDCARRILALGGHTHTLEQIRPGEVFEGWQTTLSPGQNVGPSPFPQIVSGAVCGSWWAGDFDSSVVPESWQRNGGPRGYLIIEFSGNTYRDTFKAAGMPAERQMSIDLLTPEFDAWFEAIAGWRNGNPTSEAFPPVNINDLPDTKQVRTDELAETFLSVNAWNGSRDSVVGVSYDRGPAIFMTRTQPGEGENIERTLDPFALKRQMMIARHAYSNEAEPRANGFELFRGEQQCAAGAPCSPRPADSFFWANRSMHVWRAPLPPDLAQGFHVADVTFTDHFGRTYDEKFIFEVVVERGFPFWNENNFTQLP
jgi:hypothetical protein